MVFTLLFLHMAKLAQERLLQWRATNTKIKVNMVREVWSQLLLKWTLVWQFVLSETCSIKPPQSKTRQSTSLAVSCRSIARKFLICLTQLTSRNSSLAKKRKDSKLGGPKVTNSRSKTCLCLDATMRSTQSSYTTKAWKIKSLHHITSTMHQVAPMLSSHFKLKS